MPMPHRTFVQVAKRRLVGKEGTGLAIFAFCGG